MTEQSLGQILLTGVESTPKKRLLLMIRVMPSFQFYSYSGSMPRSFSISSMLFSSQETCPFGETEREEASIDSLRCLSALFLSIWCSRYLQRRSLLAVISSLRPSNVWAVSRVLWLLVACWHSMTNAAIFWQRAHLKSSSSMVRVSTLSETLRLRVRMWKTLVSRPEARALSESINK